jgi:hypothetical protein
MDVELAKVWFQEEQKRVLATVSYREQQPSGAWNSATVEIFLDWIDSHAEIKRQAFEKAKAFLLHAASDR